VPRICATPGPWHTTDAAPQRQGHDVVAAGLLPRRQAPGRCSVAGATFAATATVLSRRPTATSCLTHSNAEEWHWKPSTTPPLSQEGAKHLQT
jgi:hypothetical protein